MSENEIAKRVLDAAFVVHTKLGPGVFESVYEVILAHELRKAGLVVERQKPMPITYEGILFDEGFRIDLLVEAKVIVELKSVAALLPVHTKQVLTQIAVERLEAGTVNQFRRDAFKERH
jgi:GxxExxY protein